MTGNNSNSPGPPEYKPQPPSSPSSWRPWIEAGLLVLFWGIVALLTLGRQAFDPHVADTGLLEGQVLYFILEIALWALVTPLLFWITPRISPDRIGWFRTAPIAVGMGIIVAVTVDLIDHIFWNTLVINGEPRPLSVAFVMDNFHFANEFLIYVAILIAGFGRDFFLRFQEQQKEAIQLRMDTAQLQTHLAEARLRALRMQINPHFLFNTLHIISDHFEEDPRVARRIIARLSDILRYTLERTDTREAPLQQELEFIDSYLDIQRFRFEDRLQVKTEIASEVTDALIPTLILQPLVENAIKHGVNQIEAQGEICIRAWREDAEMHLQVSDNGPGQSTRNGSTQKSGGIGLRNTSERLEMLYGSSQRLTVDSPPDGGFVVHLVLPYHRSSDYFLSAIEE